MTTPNQSSVTPETLQRVAALLPLPTCAHEAHYTQGEVRSCRRDRIREHADQVRALVEPWQQLTDERDQAIRERDEARAAVARVEWLRQSYAEESANRRTVGDNEGSGWCDDFAGDLRAALSGGAGEQDKAEERRAPVQADHDKAAGTVTWAEHEQAWQGYAARYGRNQSAERIAERGGFGYHEMTYLLGRKPETWEAGRG